MKLVQSEKYEDSVALAKDAMAPYYDEYGLIWDDDQRLSAYRSCELFEINSGVTAGFLLIRTTDTEMYVGDLQIESEHRNKGLGAFVLKEVKYLAKKRGYNKVKLKVFKSCPAINLYLRCSFKVVAEEQYVFVMELST